MNEQQTKPTPVAAIRTIWQYDSVEVQHHREGRRPARFEVWQDGKLAFTYPATYAWQTVRRNAIAKAAGLVGVAPTAGTTTLLPQQVVPLARITPLISALAELGREENHATSQRVLMEQARSHADAVAAQGLTAFSTLERQVQKELTLRYDEAAAAARTRTIRYRS